MSDFDNLYTGTFKSLDAYKEFGLFPISIATWEPTDFSGYTIKKLAPERDITDAINKDTITLLEFVDYYKNLLSSEQGEQGIKELRDISNNLPLGYTKAVVLDYSSTVLGNAPLLNEAVVKGLITVKNFSHRFLLAEYFDNFYGISLPEFVGPIESGTIIRDMKSNALDMLLGVSYG